MCLFGRGDPGRVTGVCSGGHPCLCPTHPRGNQVLGEAVLEQTREQGVLSILVGFLSPGGSPRTVSVLAKGLLAASFFFFHGVCDLSMLLKH